MRALPIVLAVCWSTFAAVAQRPPALELLPPIGPAMVLPQSSTVPFRGRGTPGARLSVQLHWREEGLVTTVGADGRFEVPVRTPLAGGPFTIEVSCGDERLVLDDVLVGDVWLASGQSNMEMALGAVGGWQQGVHDWEREVAAADLPRLRVFTVERRTAAEPLGTVAGRWQVCSPATAKAFSATAFFFGRELLARRKEPLGLIVSCWGGTIAEAWTSSTGLEAFPEFAPAIAALQARAAAGSATAQRAAFWRAVEASGPRAGGQGPEAAGYDDAGWTEVQLPHVWSKHEQGGFDGVGWYRRVIAVPPAWVGHELVLMLGPIDDMDSVWFAGRKIGGAEEAGHWAEPREYRIPGDAVVAGGAVLAVRVVDTGGEGGIGGDAEGMRLFPAAGEVGGIGLADGWRFARGAKLASLPPFADPGDDPNQPTALWNAMIAPLCGFPVRGVIWYQGESNRGRAEQYSRLFPALIRDWRRAFASELPFYFVQIAPYAYGNDRGEAFDLRRAQAAALQLPATGMATTTDVGEPDDIHPRQKQPVGERLARLALRGCYGQRDVAAEAPRVRAVAALGATLRIEFDGADGGLRAGPDGPRHLELAGADGVFHPARARIEGGALLVECAEVQAPRQARYCHAAAAIGDLANAAGLPAGPFLATVGD